MDKLDYYVIALTKDEFGDKLWQTVSEQLRILLTAGYEAKVRYDEPAFGIVVIEFAHNNKIGDDWGTDRLMWVTSAEEDDIILNRNYKKSVEDFDRLADAYDED